MQFDWDSQNTKHIRRHRITPDEVEQVLNGDPLVVQFQEHPVEDRFLVLGHTNSGRMLAVVYTERGKKIRVVTAYRMTKRQQRFYLRER